MNSYFCTRAPHIGSSSLGLNQEAGVVGMGQAWTVAAAGALKVQCWEEALARLGGFS